MSYREKSTWVLLVSTLLVFIPYFVWFMFDLNRSIATFGVSFSITIVLSGILNIGGHVFLLWRNPEERQDERDFQIEYRSLKAAYFTHGISMFLSIGWILAIAIAQSYPDSPFRRPVVICHVFMFCFILAEIVRYARSVALYRRGVPA